MHAAVYTSSYGTYEQADFKGLSDVIGVVDYQVTENSRPRENKWPLPMVAGQTQFTWNNNR